MRQTHDLIDDLFIAAIVLVSLAFVVAVGFQIEAILTQGR
ncbi:hypothetical protein GGR12_002199 [Brevundimonas lenta]|uniref:Uncharacterized protein n=1 Tax=Brevundimonas lenta TaxID=424796 RepID=A0A7W6JDW1_9CAUL|nr:hypothetical protein [Brevundimonas lenta]